MGNDKTQDNTIHKLDLNVYCAKAFRNLNSMVTLSIN